MKLYQAFVSVAALATSVVGVARTNKDQYHASPSKSIGNSLWVFGSEGVTIFSPDGSENRKIVPKEDICHMRAGYRGGDPTLSCSFYGVASDGKKYVWAAVTRGVPKIDILDINTGDVVGSFETCGSPRSLEYHPLREEMWVRCSQVGRDTTYPSYMDVFSTASPSSAITSDMKFKEDTTINSWGYTVIDNTLGDVGYSTDYDQPKLFKMDLSTKSIIESFDVPLARGTYEVAYSPMNRHVFLRTSVCCTCGFPGADKEDCGRYGSDTVNVTTGPSAGQMNVQGTCGRCDGVAGVDILGVYEFDTTTDTFVGNHIMKENFGGDPYPSPDGRFIVLVGHNGGTTIRILETGATSEKSTVFADLSLGFNATYHEDDVVYSDFAFVEKDGKNILVFVSGTENRAAIVDITGGASNIKTTYVNLAEGESTSRRLRRQIEWAVGTNYVWIDGTGNQEIYVIDVMKAELVTMLTGISTTKMLSVQNYAKMAQDKIQMEAIQSAVDAQMKMIKQSAEDAAANAPATQKEDMVKAAVEATQPTYTDDNDIDLVGILGLIIGACALVVGTMNVFVMSGMKNQISSNQDDLKSLGSKDVA